MYEGVCECVCASLYYLQYNHTLTLLHTDCFSHTIPYPSLLSYYPLSPPVPSQEESLLDFQAAIKYGAPVLPTVTTRAKVYCKMNRFDDAISDLSVALSRYIPLYTPYIPLHTPISPYSITLNLYGYTIYTQLLSIVKQRI
jgi:hypothetical protein